MPTQTTDASHVAEAMADEVFVPELEPFVPELRPPSRFSASTLYDASRCLLLHRSRREADDTGPLAQVGRAFHEVAATVALNCKLLQQETVDEARALDLLDRTLRNPDEHGPLPGGSYHSLRQMVSRWAAVAHFPVAADVFAIEVDVRHQLGRHTLSGRLDWLAIDGALAEITDYKTGPRLPTQKEVEDEHVQLPIYAWHVWQDHPGIEVFLVTELYTRYGVPRQVIITADELYEWEDWLQIECDRLSAAWDDGSPEAFPPSSGSWCGQCAVARTCPLPHDRKPGVFLAADAEAQALAQAEALLVDKRSVTLREQTLAAWLDATGRRCLQVGDTEVGYPDPGSLKPRRELDAKLAEAEGVDLDQFRVEKPPAATFGTRRASS